MLKRCCVVTIATVIPVLMAEFWTPGFSQEAGDSLGADTPPLSTPSSLPPSSILDTPTAEELITFFKRGQPPLGSRSSLCTISPGIVGDRDVVWGDRPLFLWQGDADRVVLEDFYSGDVIWEKSLPSSAQVNIAELSLTAVPYDGEALQPDQLYRWQLFQGNDAGAERLFGLVAGDRQTAITNNLTQLQAQLEAQRVSEEAETLTLAQFFGEQGLWSDAFSVLFEGETISAGISQVITEMTVHLCGETIAEGDRPVATETTQEGES